MPKKTNKQKWNEARKLLDEIGNKYIKLVFPNGIPKHFYQINNKYEIECIPIDKIRYSFGRVFPFDTTKITNKDIDKINSVIANPPTLDENNIFLEFKVVFGKFTSQSSIALKTITERKVVSFVHNDLIDECKRRKELYTIKPGDIACKYCRKAFPKKDAIKRRIFNYKMYGPGGKEFEYCSNQCGAYDQMAHEG